MTSMHGEELSKKKKNLKGMTGRKKIRADSSRKNNC